MSDAPEQNLTLPPIIDLDALDDVRDQILGAMDNGSIEIDASSVERVATNALVMMLSAAETAKRNDFAFSVTAASEPMVAAIERLGMGESFAPILKG